MVRCKSSSRFLSIIKPTILTQTDTTVGFLSQNANKLFEIKSRDNSKPFIKVYCDFKTLLLHKHRIPQNQKTLVRRSKKTTFIIKNRAFRVSNNNLNSTLLDKLDWCYSTSANESGKKFDRKFCEEKVDMIIEDKNLLTEQSSSTLIKINNLKKRKLR